MTHYRQCLLVQEGRLQDNARPGQVAWLPESFAKLGARVRLRDEEGWVVTQVFSQRIPDDYLKEYASRDYRTQRQASDI